MTLKQLDAEAAKQFDRFVKARDAARKASKADRDKKEAQQLVIDAMGDELRAQLPDGRVIQRLQKSRDMPAKKATTQQWWELFEAEA